MRIPTAKFHAPHQGGEKCPITLRADHISAIEELSMRTKHMDSSGHSWPEGTETLIYLAGGRVIGVAEAYWDVINDINAALEKH